MAQYREGAVNLLFGETAVSGTGTRWLANVTTGDMLLIGSNGPAAFVASVLSDTELMLEQGWPGPDAAGAVYAIHRDFDPTTGAPLMAPGDTALHIIFNRAISRLSVQTGAAIAGSEAAQQAAAARTGAEAAAATAVTASEAADDAKAAAQTAAQTASADATTASAAAATAAADATSASDDAAAAAVSATTAGTAATAAGAAKDMAVASSGTATAAAAAAGTSAASAATSAGQAQDAAATATQAASDTDGARDAAVAAATAAAQDATAAAAAAVTAGSAKDDADTAASAAQSDAADALAARNLAQAWAVSPENTPVPQYPGLYSALHWAKKAADSAAEAAGIVTGNNFGVIGDGGSAQFNAGGPGATLNFVAGAGVQLGFDAGTRAVSIGNADTAVTPGSFGTATQVGTYTVDAHGRLTASANVTITPAWSSITAKPTTLSGFGITDAMPSTGGTFSGDVSGPNFTVGAQSTEAGVGTVTLGVGNPGTLTFSTAQTLVPGDVVVLAANGLAYPVLSGSGTSYAQANSIATAVTGSTFTIHRTKKLVSAAADHTNPNFGIYYRQRNPRLIIGSPATVPGINDALSTGLSITDSGDSTLSSLASVSLTTFSSSVGSSPSVFTQRGRGTASSISAVQAGDVLFNANFGGYGLGSDATMRRLGCVSLSVAADTAPLGTTNSLPARLYLGATDGMGGNATRMAFEGGGWKFTSGKTTANADAPFVVNTGGADRLTVAGDGKVGIGTAAPLAKLQVQDTAGVIATQATGSNHAFASDTTSIVLGSLTGTARFAAFGANAGYDLHFAGATGPGIAAPSYPISPTNIGNIRWRGWDEATSSWVNGASIGAQTEANWTSTVRATGLTFNTTQGTTNTEQFRVRSDGALAMAANAVKIFNPSGHLVTRPYTTATLPAATDTGEVIYVTDATGGAVPAYWNGTAWARVSDLSDVTGAPASGGGGGGGVELVQVVTVSSAVSSVSFSVMDGNPGIYSLYFEGVVCTDGNLAIQIEIDGTWLAGATDYTYRMEYVDIFTETPTIVRTAAAYIQINTNGSNACSGTLKIIGSTADIWPNSTGRSIVSEAYENLGTHFDSPKKWETWGQRSMLASQALSDLRFITSTGGSITDGTFRLYRKQTSL